MGTSCAWREHLAGLSERAVELLGTDGASWPNLVAGRVESALKDWDLEVVAPLTGGRGGLVLRVRRGGDQFVLKAPMVEPVAHISAQEYLARAEAGPRIVATDTERCLFLMEHIAGGPVDHPTPAAVVSRAAQALRPIHATATTAFPPIYPWLRSRLTHQPSDRPATAAEPSPRERREALYLLDELEETSTADFFIHGDLNVGNILWADSGLIRLIDARGVVGDPAYDYAALAVKTQQPDPSSSGLAGTARMLAVVAGFENPERCAQWVPIVLAAQV